MSPAAKRTVRTVLQTAVGLAVALPGILDAAGLARAGWAAGAVAVAGAVARVMALPTVERLLDRLGLGLVDDPDGGAPQ
ncbi:hypothetical protein ACFOOM_10245 [Streptomyces echinoruber]|uniref:hypothetical protein n=1 Tax=Streptomyces echinoruber TaxID=68898 RepID=UPI003613664B